MGIRKPASPERDRLADELAELKAAIKALTAEQDSTAALVTLRKDVERLKLEKDRLTEDHDRKVRETEHKVGLLKLKQDHDVANARRETKIEVREENLAADKDRFKAEMDFQRERLQGEVERIDGILRAILERLPAIEVELGGSASTGRSRKAD